MKRFHLALIACLLASPALCTAAAPEPREWMVDGVKREALVALPDSAKEKPSPVVFVFHGHGGTMRNAARSFNIHTLWPEAIVVYPQGLNTPGMLTDPEGKRAGWQHQEGAQGDRDLKFFDAMLAGLKKDYKVDDARIYATGHSNGGGFTYLLWATRGDVLAAVAPSAAVRFRRGAGLTPKPVLHVAGEKDNLVKFAWQEQMIEVLKKVNHVNGDGKPWGEKATIFSSETGPPVVTLIHPGGHQFPREAPAAMVKFFKAHAKQTTAQ